MQESHYVGRFAPPPSGDLHFGSLIAALGSYLQARARYGQWLVRIEDIDPPREVAGAASRILYALEHYGLFWDGQVIYQSQRHDAYRAALDLLQRQGLCYYCTCPRSRIQHIGGLYDGHCRDLHFGPQGAAIRLRQFAPVYAFHDGLRDELRTAPALASEDFIIRRRDGLFAYNLVVVIDDHFQGVTEIVRGADLIAPTVRQIALYHQLQLPSCSSQCPLTCICRWRWVPMASSYRSKIMRLRCPVLVAALKFLCQPLPESWQDLDLSLLLSWVVAHWKRENVPSQDAIAWLKTHRHSQRNQGEL
ncbi:tRNA glutamyl-Q(34) synthetase GluQRS [Serratia symbiotica]|uniref:tRNA glutamyl-Q(34) synthetase GluQRS n=1 Tax=Serratia symbiotica TaxID=138074 RepID=UPI002090BA13|nr:tRNA glutamyl-Q(34) synthetase GluQRS [Serratia symbiotica]USS95841.1 tRNA glutamyl-Q(34) synthetase GluQRS [Serratia symbiotica]